MRRHEPSGMSRGEALRFSRGMSKPCWIGYQHSIHSYIATTDPNDESLIYLIEIGMDGKSKDVRAQYQKKHTVNKDELSPSLRDLD